MVSGRDATEFRCRGHNAVDALCLRERALFGGLELGGGLGFLNAYWRAWGAGGILFQHGCFVYHCYSMIEASAIGGFCNST